MKQLPNLLTSINLLMGCLSIIALASGRAELLFYLMAIGLLADFLDGFAARLLKAYSELGKQLDSLADMISFGLLPGLIFYYLIAGSLQTWSWWAFLGFLYTVAAAWRLAKFNIDTRQSQHFLGLPTPAGAIFVFGLLYWYLYPEQAWLSFFDLPFAIYLSVLLISIALLIELPMFSFKISSWQWVGNEIKFIFALIAAILFLVGQFASLPIIVVLYLLLSIGEWFFTRKNS